MNRRDFVQLMGLASGATLISSCGIERETEKLIPYLVPPDDGVIPGKAVYYNTTCTECPAGCGVSAKVMDYKAAKLEGNPAHPVNGGALCMRGQASISRLYHPDRLSHPLRRGATGGFEEISWDEAYTAVVEAQRAESLAEKTNVFLAGQTTGTLSELIDSFCKDTRVERLPEFEVFSYTSIRDANRIAFGRREIPTYHLERADWALTIGADMFETFVSPVSHAAQFGRAKKRKTFEWTHVEPHVSLTGAQATHRHAITPGGELYLVTYLLREVSKANVTGDRRIAGIVDALPDLSPRGFAEKTGLSVDELSRLAHGLQSAVNPLVVAGGVSTAQKNGLDIAVLTAVLQWAMGMNGRTVSFDITPSYDGVGSLKDIETLSRRMAGDEIGVLFVTRADPIGILANKGAGEALSSFEKNFDRAALRVGMGDFMNPTLERCDIVLPLAHALESWGDGNPREDIRGIIQPAIEPVNASKTEGDVLIQLLRRYQGATTALTYQEFLVGRLKNKYGADSVEKMLSEGFILQRVIDQPVEFDRDGVTRHVRGISLSDAAVKPALVVAPSIRFFDGRGRDIKLLEEIPDPLTTVSYGGWVSVAVESARDLGVEDKDEINVSGQGWSLSLPVRVQPGLPRGVMSVQYSPDLGIPLVGDAKTGEMTAVLEGVSVKKTGKKIALPILSGSQSQEGRGVIPDDTPKESHGHDGHGEGGEHPSFYPKHDHKDYRWGMAIDLDLCIGCSACAAACHIENNVPVVGPELHLNGREMSWIRIEPFYDDNENVEFQPMMCQHCDNAPCETVCPVYATYHNPEGLNAQVYNRCVGTRYCSNNCPYKVRRFNWFDFKRPTADNPTRNPEVSVRGRGIMEKCTFCVQRIRSARENAKDEKRLIKDGEVVPACAQTCPTNAISFGNLDDKNSEVSHMAASDRAHRVFDLLGTEPAVFYLKGKGKKDHHG